MTAWLQDIFCSLDSVAYRPCGTSSWCFLPICFVLVLGSGHFGALRFALLHHAFFQRRFGIFARCIRCFMTHCYLRRARKSLEDIFFSDLARLRVFLACLKLYLVFSLVDLLWFRLRPARTQLCTCTAAGTCSTSPDCSLRRPFGSCSRTSSCSVVVPLFILARCPISFRFFFFFQAHYSVDALDNWGSAVSCTFLCLIMHHLLG